MPKRYHLSEKSMMTERRNSEKMYPIISKYEAGELNRQQCCEAYDLTEAVFWYWLSKYRKEKRAENTFIPLGLDISGPKTMELIQTNGQVLRFYGYPRPDYLRSLIDDR
jgi:hypothetical protein